MIGMDKRTERETDSISFEIAHVCLATFLQQKSFLILSSQF